MRFILLLWIVPVCAADAQLEALLATLSTVRAVPEAARGPRGTAPALTKAKHQLRDWVESRLIGFRWGEDETAFAHQLNAELKGTGLLEKTEPGYIAEIRLQRQGGFLLLQTGMAIDGCGFDDSVYLLRTTSEGWRRVWQNEQNNYTEKEYRPQSLHSVQISPWNKENDYFVMTLGTFSWCSSAWHPVYFRVYRLGPDPEAVPLIEGSETSFLGARNPPILGSISRDSVLIEYSVRSIDAGVHSRAKVRKYALGKDHRPSRVAPVALKPRDFVDEWLTSDWKESRAWSNAETRKALSDWHTKLHTDFVSGDFLYPTMHCQSRPDWWQVGIEFSNQPEPLYFRVQWRPPYKFTLLRVSETPDASCSEKDPEADEGARTLFPLPAEQ